MRTIALVGLLMSGFATAGIGGVTPGGPAPDFTLTDTEGGTHHLRAYLDEGNVVVLEWFNPECPFVKKHHQANRTMADLAERYAEQGVVWLAVNSGSEGKQGAGLERNRQARGDYRIAYPVLLDGDGTVGKQYGATNTPHMFVITPPGRVAYAGAIDDDPDPRELGEVNHVEQALDAVLESKPVAVRQTKAYGCSVKY